MDVLLIVILAVIGIIAGGIYQIISHINVILFGIVVVAIILGVLVGLIRLFYRIYEKNKDAWYFLNYISIT